MPTIVLIDADRDAFVFDLIKRSLRGVAAGVDQADLETKLRNSGVSEQETRAALVVLEKDNLIRINP